MKKLFQLLLLTICIIFTSTASAENIRVGLVENQKTCELKSNSDFTVYCEGAEESFKKGKYFVHIENDKLYLDKKLGFVDSIIIKSADGKPLSINKRDYKGSLKISMANENLLVMNELDIEDYLASVVPIKVMQIWPDEAIKAQAVAARSYALYSKNNSSKPYDIFANDKELRYYGTGKDVEREGITKFVEATRGEYLAYYGAPIKALTTQSTGGQTEAVSGYPYLASVKDFDSDSPDNAWEKRVNPFLLQNFVERGGHKIGKLKCVFLSPLDEIGQDRTSSGRVKYMILSGDKGSAQITGKELAEILELPSTLFDVRSEVPIPETLSLPITNSWGFEVGAMEMPIEINTDDKPIWKNKKAYHLISGGKEEKLIFKGRARGEGHGLSTWGAKGMADEKEANYREILAHYYPGTSLIK